MKTHAKYDLGTTYVPPEIINYISDKNYAMFLYFDHAEKIKPFNIDKRGFGAMAAWVTVDNIKNIQI